MRTISVGIPTYNESANIEFLLDDIDRSFREINGADNFDQILISDSGSDDGTQEKVRSWGKRNPHVKISLLEHSIRVGKFENLNVIFSNATSDVLVCLDADVRLPSKSLGKLLSHFEAGCSAPYVVWGTDIPSRSDLHYRASAFQMNLENRKRELLPTDTAFPAGVFFALKREVYFHFRFTAGRIADDMSLADFVLEHKLKAKQDTEAFVIATPAGSVLDFYLQTYRGIAAMKLRKSQNIAENQISKFSMLRIRLREFMRDPMGASLLVLYRTVCLVINKTRAQKFTDTWPIAQTTKA
jgi:glycosyltransferase involved in cell wall biosynthesis